MKKDSAEFFGHSVLFARKSRLFSISLFRRWGMRRFSLSLVVFPALFLLIFSLAVLGGTAAAYTEGASNNFFGTGAGASNTGGNYNSFFGGYAGTPTRPGTTIPFLADPPATPTRPGTTIPFLAIRRLQQHDRGLQFLFWAIRRPLQHDRVLQFLFWRIRRLLQHDRALQFLFWRCAGHSNTVENYNTFVGYNADLDGTTDSVTNATAIGAHAYVAQSNSLVLGSIAGVNSATSNVNVGIGTPAPARQLHLKAITPSSAWTGARIPPPSCWCVPMPAALPMKTFVVGTNASGANKGEFVINDLGTAVAGPGTRRMTITNNGAVDFPGIVSALAIHPDEFARLQDQCPNLRKCA